MVSPISSLTIRSHFFHLINLSKTSNECHDDTIFAHSSLSPQRFTFMSSLLGAANCMAWAASCTSASKIYYPLQCADTVELQDRQLHSSFYCKRVLMHLVSNPGRKFWNNFFQIIIITYTSQPSKSWVRLCALWAFPVHSFMNLSNNEGLILM